MFPKVLTTDMVARLQAKFESVAGSADGSGTRHVDGASLSDEGRNPLLTDPLLLAVVRHILRRPFRVLLVNGRDPRPGYGLQGLHADWLPRLPGDPYSVVTALWLLDPFTPTNGATRLVPGSHLLPGLPSKQLRAPQSRHPDETIVTGEAGGLLAFNGHLWHSGTRNDSHRPRRVVQCQFVAHDAAPPEGSGIAAGDRKGT